MSFSDDDFEDHVFSQDTCNTLDTLEYNRMDSRSKDFYERGTNGHYERKKRVSVVLEKASDDKLEVDEALVVKEEGAGGKINVIEKAAAKEECLKLVKADLLAEMCKCINQAAMCKAMQGAMHDFAEGVERQITEVEKTMLMKMNNISL